MRKANPASLAAREALPPPSSKGSAPAQLVCLALLLSLLALACRIVSIL
jgi:hypothetical protein